MVVDAILTAAKGIRATIAGSDSGGSDGLNKSLTALRKELLPHWAEELEKRAEKVRDTITKEFNRGPLQVKAVGDGKRKRRR